MELTYPPGHEIVLELQREIAECSPSELRALRVLMTKLKAGRAKYGSLDLAADRRNWLDEVRAEVKDAMWYLAFAEVAEGA